MDEIDGFLICDLPSLGVFCCEEVEGVDSPAVTAAAAADDDVGGDDGYNNVEEGAIVAGASSRGVAAESTAIRARSMVVEVALR